MAERWDAIVVGGGAMGTSTARWLAARGRRTLLMERFRIGHANGSSHGPNRIFRLAYHHPDYVRMARLALEEWRRLEDEAGEPLLDTTGGLDSGEGASVAADALRKAGEAFQWLDADAARERWPLLAPPGGPLLFQPEAGVCHADATVAAQARLAGAAGATVLEETVAAALRLADGAVEVATATEVHHAPIAVITAGAWAQPLLATAGLDVPLRVTREVIAYARFPGPAALPTLIEWPPPGRPFARYALPVPGRPELVKFGAHQAGETVDPGDHHAGPDVASTRALHGYAAERFPRARIDRTETCLYTNTADEDFVLDRVGPVVIGSPCSGHGFKFTPLIGRILADLATGEEPPVPLGRFAWDRPSLRAVRP
jgi:sarcosine oxidase